MVHQIHRVEWTREKAARFWNFVSESAVAETEYFSAAVGRALITHVQRRGVKLESKQVLDFGCGPGFLLEHFLDAGAVCSGIDFSEASVDAARRRLQGKPNLESVRLASTLPTEFGDSEFDVVFLIEAIEHLLDDDLRPTLGEIHRLLRSGGFAVVSTPNQEDLARSEVMCPDCGGIFHGMQHVRSWSRESLRETMAEAGFEEVSTEETYLARPTWQSRARVLLAKTLKWKMPHLIYIGRRVAA